MEGARVCDSAFYDPTLTILNGAKHGQGRVSARLFARAVTLASILSSRRLENETDFYRFTKRRHDELGVPQGKEEADGDTEKNVDNRSAHSPAMSRRSTR